MTRQQIAVLAVLGSLNLLVVGGGAVWLVTIQRAASSAPIASDAVAITPTTAQFAPTPSPSSTPVPATATRVLALDPFVELILSAFEKTDSASSYRLQMDATASGSLAQVINSQNEVLILSMTGEGAGSDSHAVIKGYAMKRLTLDPAKAIETANVGGKSYVKGPLPLLGAKENKWYVLPDRQAVLQDSPSNLYSPFNGGGGSAVVTKGATEKLDGRVCDVYAGDKYAALAAFQNLGGTSQLSASQADRFQSSIQSAEFKLWICDDGYVHQMRMSLDGIDPSLSRSRFGFKILVHIFDFGAKISITAPTNALPAKPLIDLNPIARATATPFGYSTYGLPPFNLPPITPWATFPAPEFNAYPTFSFPFFSPASTPAVR